MSKSYNLVFGKGVFSKTIFIPAFKAISICFSSEYPVIPAIMG